MATYSAILGLKLNAPSDQFLLADFTANWQILDASPGTYVCTSLTQPSWSSGQAGRRILMTDQKYEQFWDGTAFQDQRQGAPVFAGGSYINTSMARNTSPNFTVLTFTTPRPCAIAIAIVATYQCSNQQNQDAWQSVVFDGTRQNLGAYREQIRFSGNAQDSGLTAGDAATSLAIVPSVTPGQHTVGIGVDVGTYPAAITIIGVKALAFIALYRSSNVL